MTAPTPAQTRPEHDVEDLVTEEMVDRAYDIFARASHHSDDRVGIAYALRAVAPMIAERVIHQHKLAVVLPMAAEREACAKIAESKHAPAGSPSPAVTECRVLARRIAAAIRARGETT